MTAVEWLSEKYNYVTWLRNRDEISPEVADNLRERYLNQAKQMEKEQSLDMFNQGYDYRSSKDSSMIEMYGENSVLSFEDYYNEVYGK